MTQRLAFGALLATLVFPVAVGTENGRQLKLYVLSSLDSDMTVIDVETNTIIGAVDVGELPHGLASPATEDVLYVSTEGDDTLVVVDPATDTVVKKYPILGGKPNEIDVTPDGRFVYVPSRGDGVYEVFDTVEETIVARMPTDGGPHNAVTSPDGKHMYLSPLGQNDKIYIADTRAHTIVGTIPTEHAPRPIAISPDGKYLYVNTDELLGFKVIDLEKRKVDLRQLGVAADKETRLVHVHSDRADAAHRLEPREGEGSQNVVVGDLPARPSVRPHAWLREAGCADSSP